MFPIFLHRALCLHADRLSANNIVSQQLADDNVDIPTAEAMCFGHCANSATDDVMKAPFDISVMFEFFENLSTIFCSRLVKSQYKLKY